MKEKLEKYDVLELVNAGRLKGCGEGGLGIVINDAEAGLASRGLFASAVREAAMVLVVFVTGGFGLKISCLWDAITGRAVANLGTQFATCICPASSPHRH